MRFTVDGSEALEQRIQADMARIRAAALAAVGAENLTALVLGGGYGRGEGGVYVVDGEERVYNDYDLFVVVPFTSRRRRNWVAARLAEVKAQVEPNCGIHVDFSPPMPLSSLPHQPYELMYMEARAGYHVVHGPSDVLDALPAYDVAHPPLEECARLFMNRGVGLLMAQMLLREKHVLDREEHEFVVRNIYKALLAMGDSVLFIEGRYDPSYLERRARVQDSGLEGVPSPGRLRGLYEMALAFKLRPSHEVPDGQPVAAWLSEMVEAYLSVFLWFEGSRLGRDDLTWDGYRRLPRRLPQLSGTGRLKNIVRNLRRRPGGLPSPAACLLHPRDRILQRLPGLLMANSAAPRDEALVLCLWEHYG